MQINPPVQTFALDPLAAKNYTWDWTARLGTGVTISSATIIPDAPITASAPVISGTKVTSKLSGTVFGEFYNVRCQIVDSTGQADIYTLQLEGANT